MHLSGFGGPFEVACKYLKVRDLEGAATPKEGYIQEEIARSLAREREIWQRERGYRMPVPLVPYIIGRDPPIH